MADYYTELSFVIKFDSEEQSQKAKQLFDAFEEGKYPDRLDDPDWPDTGCQARVMDHAKDELWISHDESANLDNLVSFLELLLDEFEIDEPVGVEWSSTCTKPRLDAYGGGAFVVKRGAEPQFMNTAMWLDRAVEAIGQESSANCEPESRDGPPTTA